MKPIKREIYDLNIVNKIDDDISIGALKQENDTKFNNIMLNIRKGVWSKIKEESNNETN